MHAAKNSKNRLLLLRQINCIKELGPGVITGRLILQELPNYLIGGVGVVSKEELDIALLRFQPKTRSPLVFAAHTLVSDVAAHG